MRAVLEVDYFDVKFEVVFVIPEFAANITLKSFAFIAVFDCEVHLN